MLLVTELGLVELLVQTSRRVWESWPSGLEVVNPTPYSAFCLQTEAKERRAS